MRCHLDFTVIFIMTGNIGCFSHFNGELFGLFDGVVGRGGAAEAVGDGHIVSAAGQGGEVCNRFVDTVRPSVFEAGTTGYSRRYRTIVSTVALHVGVREGDGRYGIHIDRNVLLHHAVAAVVLSNNLVSMGLFLRGLEGLFNAVAGQAVARSPCVRDTGAYTGCESAFVEHADVQAVLFGGEAGAVDYKVSDVVHRDRLCSSLGTVVTVGYFDGDLHAASGLSPLGLDGSGACSFNSGAASEIPFVSVVSACLCDQSEGVLSLRGADADVVICRNGRTRQGIHGDIQRFAVGAVASASIYRDGVVSGAVGLCCERFLVVRDISLCKICVCPFVGVGAFACQRNRVIGACTNVVVCGSDLKSCRIVHGDGAGECLHVTCRSLVAQSCDCVVEGAGFGRGTRNLVVGEGDSSLLRSDGVRCDFPCNSQRLAVVTRHFNVIECSAQTNGGVGLDVSRCEVQTYGIVHHNGRGLCAFHKAGICSFANGDGGCYGVSMVADSRTHGQDIAVSFDGSNSLMPAVGNVAFIGGGEGQCNLIAIADGVIGIIGDVRKGEGRVVHIHDDGILGRLRAGSHRVGHSEVEGGGVAQLSTGTGDRGTVIGEIRGFGFAIHLLHPLIGQVVIGLLGNSGGQCGRAVSADGGVVDTGDLNIRVEDSDSGVFRCTTSNIAVSVGTGQRVGVCEIFMTISEFLCDINRCCSAVIGVIVLFPLVCIGAGGRQCERLAEADSVFRSRDGDIGQGQHGDSAGDLLRITCRSLVAQSCDCVVEGAGFGRSAGDYGTVEADALGSIGSPCDGRCVTVAALGGY